MRFRVVVFLAQGALYISVSCSKKPLCALGRYLVDPPTMLIVGCERWADLKAGIQGVWAWVPDEAPPHNVVYSLLVLFHDSLGAEVVSSAR